MKTWKMIKELAENPSKRFKSNLYNKELLALIKNNKLYIQNEKGVEMTNIDMSREWEEVKQPVDFMTAVKSGKKVRVEHKYIKDLCNEIYSREDCAYDYNLLNAINEGEHRDLVGLLSAICDHALNGDIQEIILNGNWYIQE